MNEEQKKALALAFNEAIKYRQEVGKQSPVPRARADDLRKAFGGGVPEKGRAGEVVIRELAEKAAPGLLGLNSPKFFAWVMGPSHPIGVAADWLTSMWGQNAGNYFCSPSAAIVEEVAGKWLLQLLDLPTISSVGFVTGATMANFTGILAGRHAVLQKVGWNVEEKGLFGAPDVNVIIGEEAHATVFSALQFAGLGRERVIKIPADGNARMEVKGCLKALENCQGPTLLILQAGQINSGDFDPFSEIIPKAHEKGAWVHIDGAFGLWARISPALKGMTTGVEDADSFSVDGHKWLQTPYDCGYAICRHPEVHAKAMTIAASYLPVEDFPDPSHFVPELSRRARGFATWAMIKHLGREGIRDLIEKHVRLAKHFAKLLALVEGVEVLNTVVLNQFVVRFGDEDQLTKRVIEEVLKDGTCFVRGALWQGKWIMRISVITGPTEEQDIRESAEAILKAWAKVKAL